MPEPTERLSPLYEEHKELGAKLVEFGGWLMPLSYPSGTIAEHLACRRGAVAFDVSHLGTIRITGPDALGLLQEQLTNDLRKIGPGRTQYTHLLDEEDGSVLDDIIVWWVEPDRFDVMPNASNTSRVTSALGGRDVTSERAVIAVQGRGARSVVASVSPDLAAVGRRNVSSVRWGETEVVVSGTGYTGEDGLELAVASEFAPALWKAVLGAGALPAGLGARDTLRLEAGLPLHGHELGPGITSLQAGLGWVLGWDKTNFRGRGAVEAEKAKGPSRLLRGVISDERRPLRQGGSITSPESGELVGVLTSGNFSPVLGCGIGLALIDTAAGLGDGSDLELDLRGKAIKARTTVLPFVEHGDRPQKEGTTP